MSNNPQDPGQQLQLFQRQPVFPIIAALIVAVLSSIVNPISCVENESNIRDGDRAHEHSHSSRSISKSELLARLQAQSRDGLYDNPLDYEYEITNGHPKVDTEKFKRQGGCMCYSHFYDPHCGSDLKEYDNGCYFMCAQQRNPGLELRWWGSCDAEGQGDSGGQGQGQISHANSRVDRDTDFDFDDFEEDRTI